MKTKSTLTLVFLFLIISFSNAQPFGHWRLGGNPAAGVDGVNAANNVFGTIPNLPINIATNSINRLHINQNTGLTNGFVGIGNNFSTPTSLLHINGIPNVTGEVFRTDCPGGVNTFWRLLRGGQEIGSLFALFNNDFRIQATQPTAKILLHTAGPTGGIRERIRIMQGFGFGGTTDVTRVGINYGATNTPIGVPRAMLHLGDDFNIASVRNWVDVGTLSALNSDHVYFGLKDEGALFSDRMDAVINWGNNVTTSFPNAFGPDNLRFIFTQRLNVGSGDPREEQNGLEIARMTPVGASRS